MPVPSKFCISTCDFCQGNSAVCVLHPPDCNLHTNNFETKGERKIRKKLIPGTKPKGGGNSASNRTIHFKVTPAHFKGKLPMDVDIHSQQLSTGKEKGITYTIGKHIHLKNLIFTSFLTVRFILQFPFSPLKNGQ